MKTSVTLEGWLLEVGEPAPKPSNFSDLGIKRHPPRLAIPFRTKEAAYWDPSTLKKGFKALLAKVKGRKAEEIAFLIKYRSGSHVSHDEVVYSPFLYYYSVKLNTARLAAKMDKLKVGIHRAAAIYLNEFIDGWVEAPVGADEGGTGYNRETPYIMELAVLLLKFKSQRVYRDPSKAKAHAKWAKRYQANNRGRSGVRHRNRKKLGRVPRRRSPKKGRKLR